MHSSGISWTDATWNLVRGCRQVSPGCRNCYAMACAHSVNKAHSKLGFPEPYEGLVQIRGGKPKWTGDVRFVTRLLVAPLRKREPLKIFVNSMSDLLYEELSNKQIAAAFGVMAAASWHAYQVLTKRAERLPRWFAWVVRTAAERGLTPAQFCFACAQEIGGADASCAKVLRRHEVIAAAADAAWPLPNVWVGVSAEDQENANLRVPFLVKAPAAVRFVSAEPLLGPVDLTPWLNDIAWVIGGCESGDGRRPADVDWLRLLRKQCLANGSAYFLKQAVGGVGITCGPGSKVKKKGIVESPYLDGTQSVAFPIAAPRCIAAPPRSPPPRSAMNIHPLQANGSGVVQEANPDETTQARFSPEDEPAQASPQEPPPGPRRRCASSSR